MGTEGKKQAVFCDVVLEVREGRLPEGEWACSWVQFMVVGEDVEAQGWRGSRSSDGRAGWAHCFVQL